MNELPSHPSDGPPPRSNHNGREVWGKVWLLLSMFYLSCEEMEDFSLLAFQGHQKIQLTPAQPTLKQLEPRSDFAMESPGGAKLFLFLPGFLFLIRLDVIIPAQSMEQVSGRWARDCFKDCHIGLWWHVPAGDTKTRTHTFQKKTQYTTMYGRLRIRPTGGTITGLTSCFSCFFNFKCTKHLLEPVQAKRSCHGGETQRLPSSYQPRHSFKLVN